MPCRTLVSCLRAFRDAAIMKAKAEAAAAKKAAEQQGGAKK